jgi:TonB-linked SusC/RagA family outer membrane protein
MRQFAALFVMLFFSVAFAFGQGQIKGVVSSIKDGSPLAGISVKVQGTNIGTSTGSDGSFVLNITSSNATLEFSGAGVLPKTVKAKGGEMITISLELETKTLSDVVVTALGVRRQPKELGYSTAIVSDKELTQARVTNAVTGLAGKVSGVDIRLADNGVNPNVKIQFRGARSLTGDNTALIVVDGIPVAQSYLATLNPDDIESVTILKGANAAALYGVQASNGVMIVTTKRAIKNRLSLNFRTTLTFEKISYMPALQSEYSGYGGEGNAKDPTTGATISYVDPLTGMPLAVPFENQQFGPAFNSLDFPLTQIADGGPDSSGKITYEPFKGLPNGRESFFQTGVNTQNDLSGNIGTKWGGFYVSGQTVNNNGVVPKDTYKRNSLKLNANGDFGKFSFAGGIDYANTKTHQTSGGYFQDRPVYWNVINQPANAELANFNNPNGNYFDGPSGYINAYYQNPWWQVYNSGQDFNTNTIISNLKLSYKILDWLTITARSGYSKTTSKGDAHVDSVLFDSTSASDPWGASNTASSFLNSTTGVSSTAYEHETMNRSWDDWNSDAFLTIAHKWKDYSLTFIAGGNMRFETSSITWWSNQSDAYTTINGTYTIVPQGNSYNKVTNTDGSAYVAEQYKANSSAVYGDLTLGYDGWIFLHASFRNDWASILAPSNRSFNYPGVDASLVLSDKLSFLKNSKTISFLKIRGGVAQTGNINIPQNRAYGDDMWNGGNGVSLPTFGAYAIYPLVSSGVGFPYGNINGNVLSTQLVEANLKPETGTNYEVGTEIGFFNDRIHFGATGYSERIINETVNENTATSTGTTNYLANVGTVSNKGLEFDLNLNPLIKSGKFRWNVGGNLSLVENKVVSLNNGLKEVELSSFFPDPFGGGIYAVVGQDFPVIKTTDFVRDSLGRIIVNAQGNPTIGSATKIMGNTAYKVFLGLTTSLSYGNFTLAAVVDYRGGAKIFNGVGFALDNAGISANSAQSRSRFVVPNSVYLDPSTGKYVANTNRTISNTYGGDDSWWAFLYDQIGAPYVTSAAFWKLREIALSYDLPSSSWMGNNKAIKKLSVSLVGRNLLMWRPATNQWTDPEFSNAGTGNAVGLNSENQTPPTRSFGFTINATF